jgi:hypothetical protein
MAAPVVPQCPFGLPGPRQLEKPIRIGDWCSSFDTESGKAYFFHLRTAYTQWNPPPGFENFARIHRRIEEGQVGGEEEEEEEGTIQIAEEETKKETEKKETEARIALDEGKGKVSLDEEEDDRKDDGEEDDGKDDGEEDGEDDGKDDGKDDGEDGEEGKDGEEGEEAVPTSVYVTTLQTLRQMDFSFLCVLIVLSFVPCLEMRLKGQNGRSCV